MPVIKSAKKKLRQDKKRTERNDLIRDRLKDLLKNAQKTKKADAIAKAVKMLDIAAKKNIIHKNKAARFKSKFSKFAKGEQKPVAKPASKTPSKKPQK